ncbi:hypothetical protein [Planifilum fimeticola]
MRRCIIDFDAGQLTEGKTMETLADDLFRYVMEVSSGRGRTKNEQWGYREIAVFKDSGKL